MTGSLTEVDHGGVIELHIVVHTRADPGQLSRMAEQLAEAFDVTPLPRGTGLVRIEVGPRRVFEHDVEVELTRLEFDLLLFLCRNAGQVCDRAVLMRHVWCSPEPDHGRTVDVHIRKLRSKIGLVAGAITTVRGVGYRFDGARLVHVVDTVPG